MQKEERAMRNIQTVTSVCSVIVKGTLNRQVAALSSWFGTSQTTTSTTNSNSSLSSLTMEKKRALLEAIRSEFIALGSPSGTSTTTAPLANSGTFHLHKDVESGIALLAIRNVNKKNCFSGAMMAQFSDFLNEVEQWKEVCHIKQKRNVLISSFLLFVCQAKSVIYCVHTIIFTTLLYYREKH